VCVANGDDICAAKERPANLSLLAFFGGSVTGISSFAACRSSLDFDAQV
jgi:hypothetical protein